MNPEDFQSVNVDYVAQTLVADKDTLELHMAAQRVLLSGFFPGRLFTINSSTDTASRIPGYISLFEGAEFPKAQLGVGRVSYEGSLPVRFEHTQLEVVSKTSRDSGVLMQWRSAKDIEKRKAKIERLNNRSNRASTVAWLGSATMLLSVVTGFGVIIDVDRERDNQDTSSPSYTDQFTETEDQLNTGLVLSVSGTAAGAAVAGIALMVGHSADKKKVNR